jgi:energy-coupling factor transporter transmembrane protein EcfT
LTAWLIATGLLIAGCSVAIAVGLLAWMALCEDGVHEECLNGDPSFATWFQALLAVLALLLGVLARVAVRRRKRIARALSFGFSLVALAAWAVFLDAATHGWDDLQLLWLG